MSFCLQCGKQLPNDAKFCSECGTPVGSTKSGYESNRQQAYAGKVIKCPSCGTEIPSFTAICPGCGHEINSSRVSTSLNDFIEKLDTLDRQIASTPKETKKGWASWSGGQRFGWIVLNIFTNCIPLVFYLILPLLKSSRTPKLTSEEEQKASFIENYAFANEREAILEALLFIESKVAFLASHQVDRKVAYWSRLWTTKAKQLYRKASMMLKGDKPADEAYADILAHNKQIKNVFKRRALIGGVILIISGVSLIVLSTTPFDFQLENDWGIDQVINTEPNYQWPVAGLAMNIPQPSAKRGEIEYDNETKFQIEVEGVSKIEFDKYINACQEMGFTIKAERTSSSYEAYNSSQYFLHISFYSWNEMEIRVEAPMTMGTIYWPTSALVKKIVKPNSDIGKIHWDRSESFAVYIANISLDAYREYVDQCISAGFNKDYTRSDELFRGYDSKGYYLAVQYQGFDTIFIRIDAPEK